MSLQGLEITPKMYCDAKKVENLWVLSEKNEQLDTLWKEERKKFHKIYGDDVEALDITVEYERRERNTDRLLSENKNVYEITYIGDTSREFKFFACSFDKEKKELYVLKDNIYGNTYPAVLYAPKIKKVECIERNNNLDFQ
jgi:hypothetical protein